MLPEVVEVLEVLDEMPQDDLIYHRTMIRQEMVVYDDWYQSVDTMRDSVEVVEVVELLE